MTYLIVSDDTIRIENEAIEFSKSFNPSDIFWIKRLDGKKEITVDVVTQLIDQSNLASVSGKKIFIIFEAELMNDNAQNKILKTIENTNDETTFIFLCKNLTNILPTIRSRSVIKYRNVMENLTIKKLYSENPDSKQVCSTAEKLINSRSVEEAIQFLPILVKPENFIITIDALNQSIKLSNFTEKKKLTLFTALSDIARNIEANCSPTNAFDILLFALFQ